MASSLRSGLLKFIDFTVVSLFFGDVYALWIDIESLGYRVEEIDKLFVQELESLPGMDSGDSIGKRESSLQGNWPRGRLLPVFATSFESGLRLN